VPLRLVPGLEPHKEAPLAVEVGCNVKKPILEVRHADLTRYSSESDFKSDCPACGEGILLVSRLIGKFLLSRYERCTLCGQAFWYTDSMVGHETFLETQPPRLTPEIVAQVAKMTEGLPNPLTPPTIWDRISADSER
jgi:hypothetical protein